MEEILNSLNEEVQRFRALASITKEDLLKNGYLCKADHFEKAAKIIAADSHEENKHCVKGGFLSP